MPPKKKNDEKGATTEDAKTTRVNSLKEKAAKALKNSEFQTALEIYADALKEDPQNHTLFSNRSAAFAMMRNFTAALDDANTCIKLAPTFSRGYYRRGFALQYMLSYQDALDAYNKGLEYEPNQTELKNGAEEISSVLSELKLSESKSDSSNPDGDKFAFMITWLRDGGAKFPKLYMKYYSEDYRGVHCLGRVPNGDMVLYVPHKYIMTSEVAKASDIGVKIVQSGIDLRSKHSYIAAYLLQEKSKGKDSFWEPYIRILPEKYANMPIFFTEDELSWLTGSFTLYKVGDRIDSLRREYDNIRNAVHEFGQFTYEEFVWARLVVITRIFGLSVKGNKTDGLVPYADMLNHKLPRETKWSYEDSMAGFAIHSLRTMQMGEQIFDSYGRKCNNRFFVNYGFALDENEDNEVVIRLELPQTDPMFSLKLRLLGGRPVTARREYQIPANYREKKCKEMFSFLRFIFAQDKEIMILTSAEGLKVDEIEPISIENETKCLKTISEACQVVMKRFPTTLEQDKTLIASGKLRQYSNERNCVVQRLGEKLVLQWFIDLEANVVPLLSKSWQVVKKIVAKACQGTSAFDGYVATVVLALMKPTK